MNQKYIVRKWRRGESNKHYWYLYRYDPVAKIYNADGRYSTLGQVLCSMDCTDLDRWCFDGQLTPPGDHTITYYRYLQNPGDGDIEVALIENPKNERCEVIMEDKISFELTPAELHEIWCLLSDKKAELKSILDSDKLTNAEAAVAIWEWYERVRKLEIRLRHNMRQWFRNEENHPYTIWRLKELESIAEFSTGCTTSWSREKEALKNAYLERAIEAEKSVLGSWDDADIGLHEKAAPK